ncbi:MAG: hypothetical protein IH840_06220, partial [Candidatus Heimdallarchaeota archaeon]|nr:hypothetical protein [Candidatus Heimdallarchaeota archaeon]
VIERFGQVDERMDEMDTILSSLQQKVTTGGSGGTSQLEAKVVELTQKLEELERKFTALQPGVSSPPVAGGNFKQVVVDATKSVTAPPPASASETAAVQAQSGSVIPAPPGAAPTASGANIPLPSNEPPPSSEATPAPSEASSPEPATTSESGLPAIPPPPPGSPAIPVPSEADTPTTPPPGKTAVPAPSSIPASSKTPTTPPESVKSKKKIDIKGDKTEREQLLEALKQLEGI